MKILFILFFLISCSGEAEKYLKDNEEHIETIQSQLVIAKEKTNQIKIEVKQYNNEILNNKIIDLENHIETIQKETDDLKISNQMAIQEYKIELKEFKVYKYFFTCFFMISCLFLVTKINILD